MFRKFIISAVSVALLIASSSVSTIAGDNVSSKARRGEKKLEIKAVPWGPTQADIDQARARAEASEQVRRELSGSKFREVGFEYLYRSSEAKSRASAPPDGYRVVYYNYSTDRALYVEGDFAGREQIRSYWVDVVPGVGGTEILEAYRLIEQDAEFGKLRQSKQVEFYEAMPPTTVVNGERLVNIGVLDPKTGENRIVGVSFKNNKVHRYENNAPPTSAATPDACGMSNSGQGSLGSGVAGQFNLTVNEQGGSSPLWEMLVIRPSSSSGAQFERSGLEVRDVKYRGKSVLKRGHVPILNVKYVNSCGPFRDWQYAEGFFNAPEAGAQNPAPGMRILAPGQVATTSIETHNDTGNFQGVAVYTQDVGFGQEVVMVTEMNAGWYRYIMEWRFGTDGTIRPRFGFASIEDSCVCIQRTHHVYWRLDFDVVGSNNRAYLMERGRRFQRLIESEAQLYKRSQLSRSIMIQSSTGSEAYQVVPGTNDGTVIDALGNVIDAFGAGDFWLMQFKGTAAAPTELDDPDGSVYPAANLSPWINGESLVDQDLVLWYAGHQVRTDDSSRLDSPNVIAGAHIVGPVLRPIRW